MKVKKMSSVCIYNGIVVILKKKGVNKKHWKKKNKRYRKREIEVQRMSGCDSERERENTSEL